MSDFENLREDIKGLGTKVDQLGSEVSVLVSKAHTPLDCPLSDKVSRLQLSEAKQRGAMAVIGTVAGLVGAGIVGGILKLVGK